MTHGAEVAMPERIQLRRSRGWRKPEGAVVVSRPTKWGNPFRYRTPYGLARVPAVDGTGEWEYENRISAAGMRHDYHHPGGRVTVCHVRYMTRAECAELYRLALLRQPTPAMRMAGGSFVKVTVRDVVRELRGRDLACWCPLVDGRGRPVPCHANVLLRVANGEASCASS